MHRQPTSPATKSVGAMIDDLQSRGRYTFATSEIAVADRSPIAAEASLRRLRQSGRIVSPRRGFQVIVPIEYRAAGCPPASWFIDDLMRHLGQSYYVGLLSASSVHGAAHQQPMVFQVITDRPTRKMTTGRVRIEFHVSKSIGEIPVEERQTETGRMRVASAEATALDLVKYADAAGYLNNIATVLHELAEKLEPSRLLALAPRYSVPDVQRLGFLLDLVGYPKVALPLAIWLKQQRHRVVPLRPGVSAIESAVDTRWGIIVNESIEIDQ